MPEKHQSGLDLPDWPQLCIKPSAGGPDLILTVWEPKGTVAQLDGKVASLFFV
jgi:hypothetical protein